MTGLGARKRARSPRSRARQSAVAGLVGALLLAACANGRSAGETAGGWFGRVLGTSSAEGQPRVAYVAEGRIKVYEKPDASSPVVGLLERHEKVARYQNVSGFAYVEAVGNLAGWVPESQLVARRPQAKAPEAEPAQPAEVTPAPEGPAETDASPSTGTDATGEGEPPDSGAQPQEPERSVFDPY